MDKLGSRDWEWNNERRILTRFPKVINKSMETDWNL